MKKILFVLILSGLVYQAQATHLMGGEITARQINGLEYQITLVNYRDTFGIPSYTSAQFIFLDTVTGWSGMINAPIDTVLSGYLLPGYPYGVEVAVYHTTYTFPYEGTFYISWNDCCRNGAILNMSNPLSESMFLQTEVMVDTTTGNSSPGFLALPVVYLPVNTYWQYNPLPFDLDGDSLHWYFDVPFTYLNAPVGGYFLPPSDTSGPISIDSQTGIISWVASNLGNYNVTVMVDEFRNGVYIGSIRRDMQFIVVDSYNEMARFSNLDDLPTNERGNYEFSLPVDESFNLKLFAFDPNVNDVVIMESYGEPYLMPSSPADFTYAPTGFGNQIMGDFNWTPRNDHVRPMPYIVVFRVKDHMFAYDEAILFRVNWYANTDNLPEKKSTKPVFPNPVKEMLFVPVELENSENIEARIFNVSGQEVMQLPAQTMAAGSGLMAIPVHRLSEGLFLIQLSASGKTIITERFIISR